MRVPGVLIWPLLVVWGHPEDGSAVALDDLRARQCDRRTIDASWLAVRCGNRLPTTRAALDPGLPCSRRIEGDITLFRLGPSARRRTPRRTISLGLARYMERSRKTARSIGLALDPVDGPGTPDRNRDRCFGTDRLVVAIIGAGAIGYICFRRRSTDFSLVYLAAIVFRAPVRERVDSRGLLHLARCGTAGARAANTCRKSGSSRRLQGLLGAGLTVATTCSYGKWWIWWGVSVAGLLVLALGWPVHVGKAWQILYRRRESPVGVGPGSVDAAECRRLLETTS